MVRSNGTHAVGGEGAPEGMLSHPRSRARDAGRDVLAAVQEIPEQIEKVNEQFVTFVKERPLVALGGAVAIGYVLGRLLRRVV